MSTDSDESGTGEAYGNHDQSADDGPLTTPTVQDASSLGLTLMVATGALLALAYYGVLGVAEAGLGRVLPVPFYLLALAVVFLVELSRTRSFDAQGLGSAVGVTAIYGTLVVLAIEGAGFLGANPDAALDGYAGVTVLAVSLVVAALAYVIYLSAAESLDWPQGRPNRNP